MLTRSILTLCFLLVFPFFLLAQGSLLSVDDTDGYDLVRRLMLRYGSEGFQQPATDLSLRPTGRSGLVRRAKTYQKLHGDGFSKVDKYRLQRFLGDDNEWLALERYASTEDPDKPSFWMMPPGI